MDGSDVDNPWAPKPVTEGEWAGWRISVGDPFEVLAGPFYTRRDEAGRVTCAFRAEQKHMNGGGFLHGGCLATFADYALFMLAETELEGVGSVTAQLNVDFTDGAREGELIEATGEVIRDGGSMVFVRGLVTTGGRTVGGFSAIVKKVRRKA